MTDPSPAPAPAAPALPPFAAVVVDRLAHLIAGLLVMALISHGLIEKDMGKEAAELVVSVLVALGSVGFAFAQARLQRYRMAAAINMPAPQIPVKP